jgi:hypothetical protein
MKGPRHARAWAELVEQFLQLLGYCGRMVLGCQRETRLVQVVRMGNLHGLIDEQWAVQLARLEILQLQIDGP